MLRKNSFRGGFCYVAWFRMEQICKCWYGLWT